MRNSWNWLSSLVELIEQLGRVGSALSISFSEPFGRSVLVVQPLPSRRSIVNHHHATWTMMISLSTINHIPLNRHQSHHRQSPPWTTTNRRPSTITLRSTNHPNVDVSPVDMSYYMSLMHGIIPTSFAGGLLSQQLLFLRAKPSGLQPRGQGSQGHLPPWWRWFIHGIRWFTGAMAAGWWLIGAKHGEISHC